MRIKTYMQVSLKACSLSWKASSVLPVSVATVSLAIVRFPVAWRAIDMSLCMPDTNQHSFLPKQTQQNSCLHCLHHMWLHPPFFSIGDWHLGQSLVWLEIQVAVAESSSFFSHQSLTMAQFAGYTNAWELHDGLDVFKAEKVLLPDGFYDRIQNTWHAHTHKLL